MWWEIQDPPVDLAVCHSLCFERDYTLVQQVEALKKRMEVLQPFIGMDHPDADAFENMWFTASNSLKALSGQLEGLQNDTLIARRSAAEFEIKEDLFQSDSLSMHYGTLFQELDEIQLSKRAEADRMAAFVFFGTAIGSRIMTRALYGYYYANLQRRGYIDEEMLNEIREDALDLDNLPLEVDKEIITLRLEELLEALGDQDPTMRKYYGGTICG